MKNKVWSDVCSTAEAKIETVFKVEPPLMPMDNGFGFMGVLLKDTTNDLLQCHTCGAWKKNLAVHINKKHHTTVDLYKDKYHLPLTCPLWNTEMLRKASERSSDPKRLLHLASVRNLKRLHGAQSFRRRSRQSKKAKGKLAFKNKMGLCPEQVMRRFLIVADLLGREPSQKDLLVHDPNLFAKIIRENKNLNTWRKINNLRVVNRPRIFGSDGLLAALIKFEKTNGRLPRAKDFQNGSPNIQTFRAHFGSINKALVLADLL